MEPKKYVDCFLLMTTALATNANNHDYGQFADGSETVTVNVSIVIDQLQMMDADGMLLRIAGLLIQEWYDPSLIDIDRRATREKAARGRIWHPRIVPINGQEQEAQCCSAAANGENPSTFWRGYGNDGRVHFSARYAVDVFCTRDFRRFPFDVNDCLVHFGSYRFTSEEVAAEWRTVDGDAVKMRGINYGDDLNGFRLGGVAIGSTVEVRNDMVGNFSRLHLTLTVNRNGWHYVYDTILPTILTIAIDYLSFWIEVVEEEEEAIVASRRNTRFAINLLAFVKCAYDFNGPRGPIVDYPTLLILFHGVSIAFALVPLVEAVAPLRKRRYAALLDRAIRFTYLIAYLFIVVVLFYGYGVRSE